MIRALSVAALFASLPAWAVGEHIAVSGPAREQLSATLCISMDCVKSGADYTVTSKVVGRQMELKVLGPTGPRFSVAFPLDDNGQLANSDAMAATSQLVQAIESPAAPKAELTRPAKEKKVSKLAKTWSKRKLAKQVRVASRRTSRG